MAPSLNTTQAQAVSTLIGMLPKLPADQVEWVKTLTDEQVEMMIDAVRHYGPDYTIEAWTGLRAQMEYVQTLMA